MMLASDDGGSRACVSRLIYVSTPCAGAPELRTFHEHFWLSPNGGRFDGAQRMLARLLTEFHAKMVHLATLADDCVCKRTLPRKRYAEMSRILYRINVTMLHCWCKGVTPGS